jgi:hypothetical protein
MKPQTARRFFQSPILSEQAAPYRAEEHSTASPSGKYLAFAQNSREEALYEELYFRKYFGIPQSCPGNIRTAPQMS